MAEVVWTEPALSDLEAIADYIAIENPEAARALVQRVLAQTDKLVQHPALGPIPPEFEGERYRKIIEPPCRIFYRIEGELAIIIHVMRSERLLREASLRHRNPKES